MVLALNNDLTDNKQLVYSCKKYLQYNHARSGQIFHPIRSEQEIFFSQKPHFCQVEN